MQKVLIYQDYIHNNGLLYRALRRRFGASVDFCDAADIASGALDGASLFVMPGGADLFYAEKLNGSGNAAIRRYVENGGTYLGICAGAYYGSTALSWAAGTEQTISGPRELAFFPGTAVGPVHDFIEDGDVNLSWQAAPEILWDDGTRARVLYEAGPVFIPRGAQDNVTILARYPALPGQPSAIVECRVGKGKAILCSPHLESGPDIARRLYHHANNSYEWNARVARLLQPSDMWDKLLDRCAA